MAAIVSNRGMDADAIAFCFSGFEQLEHMPKMRDLKSFAVYLGEALENALRVGDTLWVTRNRAGDSSYRVPILPEQARSAEAMRLGRLPCGSNANGLR
jgi:hypothetical protein